MSYTINYSVSGDFMHVLLKGAYPLEKFREISGVIDKAADENGISKIMVDLREFIGRFGVFDGINHIEKFPEESRLRKFAIVDIPENKSSNDFFENASYNRGFNLLFFYDESDAKKWLQVESYAVSEKVITVEV